MAWDYDRQMILVIRHTDSARGVGFAKIPGDVAIAARFAIWDFQQLMPDADLKWSSGQIERKVEVSSGAVKILIDLFAKDPVRFVVNDSIEWYVISKLHLGQALCRGGEGYSPEWCLDDGISHAD
jgi:hypothetical protein